MALANAAAWCCLNARYQDLTRFWSSSSSFAGRTAISRRRTGTLLQDSSMGSGWPVRRAEMPPWDVIGQVLSNSTAASGAKVPHFRRGPGEISQRGNPARALQLRMPPRAPAWADPNLKEAHRNHKAKPNQLSCSTQHPRLGVLSTRRQVLFGCWLLVVIHKKS